MSVVDNPTWYTVRCLIRIGGTATGDAAIYEERITLWRSRTFENAISRAEDEAISYATDIAGEYVGLAQAYHLADDIGDGAEVFSLMRDSPLDPDRYIARFFDTGDEHQSSTDEAP